MTKLSELEFRVVDCETNRFEWPDGFRDMWLMGHVLVVNTFRDLLFCDVSDPLRLRVLHRRKTRVARTVRTRLCGTRLVCCGDEGLEVLDVADPSDPRTVAHVKAVVHSGAFVGDTLYVPRGLGVERVDLETGALVPVAAAKGVDETEGYEADIIASRTHVVTAGHDHGVQVFAIDGDALVHVKGFAMDSACHLTWDEGEPAFFDVGERERLVRFTLDGAKPVKQKAWKTARTWLAPQVVRRGDEILTAGLRLPDSDTLHVLVASTAGDAPAPVTTKKVAGFVAKDVCSDAMRGLAMVGDTLLVASYARRLYALASA